MRKLLTITSLLALGSLAALAADIDGKWAAAMPGRDGQTREMIFNLKADGDALTGMVSSPRGDMPISEGTINGSEISFSQVMEFGQNQVKWLYKGTISGDQIKFTRSREGGQGHGGQGRGGQAQPMEFTAKRSS
jgi:hypothetical protein